MARMSTSPLVVAHVLEPVNPATLLPVGAVPTTEPEAVAEVVAEARLAQRAWGARRLEERSRLLRAVAAVLLESADEIAASIVAETGKPVVEAVATEVFVGLDNLVWLARNLDRVLRSERLPLRQAYVVQKRASLRYEPIGVVGIISPWNFPFSIPLTQAASAVAAGNAAVIKPSELTPHSGAWVEELFRRAGAPADLVRVVQGRGETTGEALVRSAEIDRVVFTGSGEVGRVVAEQAARRLCPVTLELGGKDPMLVLAGADLDRAIEGALWGSFSNCGQICSGIERIYVEGDLYEPFATGLARRAAELRLGAGEDPETDVGPLISEQQRSKVEELVADAVASGAQVLTGGARPNLDLPGWFHEPTVLVGEPQQARLRQEEIFGPVVTVVKIENAADGVRRANDSPYGLGASVWTRDHKVARSTAAQLEAGSVWMNDVAYSYGTCQAPWGGRKASGFGRTHSKHGLYDLSHVKFVDSDSGRLSPPWWFPYDARVAEGFGGVLKLLYSEGVRARLSQAWRHRGGLAVVARRSIRRR
jgi:succinate-semialdehyde dehydrogenase/glutarate-semialdehyde dehydrogenase